MIEPFWTWIFGGAVGAVGAALAIKAATVLRRRPAVNEVEPSRQEVVPLPTGGPITRLDFARSLDPEEFARAAEDEALSYVSLHLRDLIADGTNLTLHTLRQFLVRSEMVVEASTSSTAAIISGAASVQRHATSGRRLPHVINRVGGKTQEVMKEVGTGRKLIGGAAAASTIIVSAAHLIATADLARSLGLVDQKLDLLLAYRRIDQNAALERIYSSAKELLSAPLGEGQRTELWRLRGELRELRAVWRRELEHHLLKIKGPAKPTWLKRTFTFHSTTDAQISGKISEGAAQLGMVEYSMRIDLVLAITSDTWDVSLVTLADELSAMESVGRLLREKADLIAVREKRLESAQPMINGFVAIVTHYRALLNVEQETRLSSQNSDRRARLPS